MAYIIGVDGGATGTVAILTDLNGTVLNTAQGPASNYIAVGKDDAKAALFQTLHELVQGTEYTLADCKMAVIGLAGLNHEADAEVYRALISPLGLGGRVVIESDVVIAWAAATTCQPGVVIIAGTGASTFGMNAAGERAKTLGWDYVLADQGSGYWIGLQGIQAAIKAWDGRAAPTPLLQALVDHYELEKPEDMILLAYHPEFEKPDIAAFAREVSRCAAQGDTVSQQILHQAGEELGQAVCAVIRRLNIADEPFKVGQIGGAFRAGHYLTEPFENHIYHLAPQAQIEMAQYPAVVGAVIYAHHLNGTLDAPVIERLQQSSASALRWKS